MAGWNEGRPVYPPADVVADLSVPRSEANGWAKIAADERPHSGYWFPADGDPGREDTHITAYVETASEIPGGDLVQYPRDDRGPELANGGDARWNVNDRHVDAALGEIGAEAEGSDA